MGRRRQGGAVQLTKAQITYHYRYLLLHPFPVFLALPPIPVRVSVVRKCAHAEVTKAPSASLSGPHRPGDTDRCLSEPSFPEECPYQGCLALWPSEASVRGT